MANTKKYISLDKLSLYDEKIKKVISDGDAAALASAKSYADGLAVNYEKAGAVATAQEALQGNIDAVEVKADAAQAAADKAQGEVDALETYVGTIPSTATATDIVGYVQEKTSGIATDTALTELTGRVAQAETDIDAIQADYLKAADKEELNDLIAAEAETARAAEKANADAVAAIQADYLKAADKEELQGNIDTAQAAAEAAQADIDAFMASAEVGEAAVDTLREIQSYITSDGEAAATMTANISANASAIEAVEGRMDTAEGKITTLEGEMDTAQESIANLQAAIADGGSVDTRIDALEAAVGESGSVAEDIATAKDEAIAAAAEDATTKAGTAESNAKTYADGLNTSMNTRVEALEAIDHDHSNKAELDLIATGDKAKWDAAAAIAHEHGNKTVLDGITAEKVTAWDAAEGNAKTYADGLNTAMDTRVATLESWHNNFTEASEEEINALFTTTA